MSLAKWKWKKDQTTSVNILWNVKKLIKNSIYTGNHNS